jgi:hypothetical protein
MKSEKKNAERTKEGARRAEKAGGEGGETGGKTKTFFKKIEGRGSSEQTWKFINKSDMILHKIGNPVSKESKTKSTNVQTPGSGAQETGSTTQGHEQASGQWNPDPLESAIQDYLGPVSPQDLPRKSTPLNSKCHMSPLSCPGFF